MRDYELINKYQNTSYCYSLEVFSNGEYVSWGISYDTEEKAINFLKDYLSKIKKLNHDSYKKQYIDYSSHPIKIVRKICTQNWEVHTKSIEEWI